MNNRKVNSAKKNYYEKGRQATTEPSGSRGHRASSLSPEDDGTFGPLMDEDAEGELDEEYQVLQDQPNNHYLTASQLGSTLPQASGLARSYKHEIQDEDSDYAVGRGKKSRRTTSGARRAPANGNTKKQRRPPGSRSNYQVVGEGLMIDVRDKKFERAVMEQGSPGVQAQFNAIHYPNGRPTDAGASRRSSRAAAPTTFRGVSNSDEVGNDESGSHYEGTEDEHHQAAHPHQS